MTVIAVRATAAGTVADATATVIAARATVAGTVAPACVIAIPIARSAGPWSRLTG